jgi:hypothetical protein
MSSVQYRCIFLYFSSKIGRLSAVLHQVKASSGWWRCAATCALETAGSRLSSAVTLNKDPAAPQICSSGHREAGDSTSRQCHTWRPGAALLPAHWDCSGTQLALMAREAWPSNECGRASPGQQGTAARSTLEEGTQCCKAAWALQQADGFLVARSAEQRRRNRKIHQSPDFVGKMLLWCQHTCFWLIFVAPQNSCYLGALQPSWWPRMRLWGTEEKARAQQPQRPWGAQTLFSSPPLSTQQLRRKGPFPWGQSTRDVHHQIPSWSISMSASLTPLAHLCKDGPKTGLSSDLHSSLHAQPPCLVRYSTSACALHQVFQGEPTSILTKLCITVMGSRHTTPKYDCSPTEYVTLNMPLRCKGHLELHF